MSTLAEKIEQDAVSRLALPENGEPGEELARYKAFLKLESQRVQMLHRSGASGRETCLARATLLDVLLRHILEAVKARMTVARTAIPKFALVAIGGYGRAELNPFSDIDIMFLHETDMVVAGKARPELSALTDGLLYTLWDLGLKIGHSVRSVEDCVRAANSDMQSKTSLIEARLVTGAPDLFERMQAVVTAKCVRGFEDAYIKARIEDQASRRAKYGNSPFMQEPNIKNGCGGLRDYQNLLWMTFFKYRIRKLEELAPQGLITEAEMKQLDSAYDYLLWVRNELHYTAKRAVDVLTKSIQPAVATGLGFTERSPSKRIEQFMGEVYMHLRNIYLITRTLEERLALLPSAGRIGSIKDLFRRGKSKVTQHIVDGFVITDGKISENIRSFKEQPRRLMRLFLYMQQRGLRLHPDLAQAIRNQLSLVNRQFLEDEHIHQTFLEILNQRGSVSRVLRAMHETGLLGKYIPEFGKLTCLVQHEFYHQYTADEHTLVCLAKLDQIAEGKDPALNHYAQLFQQVERPFVLYLALLLHDAGKALESDHDHADTGAQIALNVAHRLGLDGATTHSLRLLIENHLLMAQISQRRDLEDPAVIRSFATQMQTRENVMMLTLMTYADSNGTSDQLWNSFKDSLLWTLFSRTMELSSGGADLDRAEEQQLQLLKEEVTRALPSTFSPDEIQAHFQHLPTRYFQIHTARQIAADLTMAHRFMHLQLAEEDKALEPIVIWHNEPDRGYTSVHICTWDRAGLFAKIAGSLAAAGLNILSAQIFTRTDGIILDTFYVNDAHGAALAKKEEKEAFERILKEALTGHVDFPALIAKKRAPQRIYQSLEGERMPTIIGFDNETSEQRTILDLQTEDRIGLLYYISRTLADLGLDISLAKILTEKGAAVDTFYITTWDKQKILSREHQAYIEHRLQEAISALD